VRTAPRRAFLAVTFTAALAVGGGIVGVAATTPPPAAWAMQGPQGAPVAQPAAAPTPDPAAVASDIDALGARANQLADAVVTFAQNGTTDTATANQLYARLVAVARQLVRARRSVTTGAVAPPARAPSSGGNGGGSD
jgi:hypothetical protein